MRRLCECLLLLGALFAVVLLLYVVSVCLRPMTVCLTFDDGLKAHATIAGPALSQYGWHGMFAIVTEPDHTQHLVFSEYKMATSDEIRALHEAGHLIVPHTVTHVNLKTLSEAGDVARIQTEIAESCRAVAAITGKTPKYFVFPYNAWTESVSSCVRENGMIPVEGGRTDFGENCTRYKTGEDIRTYILTLARSGQLHDDLMIHGIGDGGGWRAFSEASFASFLSELKSLEDEASIRIVDFTAAHENGSLFDCALMVHRKVGGFVRRQVYSVCPLIHKS